MTTVQTNNKVNEDLMAAMNPAKKATSSTQDAQDRFMTLLVTQMKNQDPLNPLDNAQVTSQLAQLSTVTGIEKLNATMESLMGSYQASQQVAAANMIGHGVFVPGSSLELQDKKALLGLELTEPADKVVVTISDSTGKAVHTMDLGALKAGVHPLAWDGETAKGDAPNGEYTFKVVATRGNEKVEATNLSFGVVNSVTSNAQGVKLTLPGVGDFTMADVKQIL
ncbi:flagellar hook assembly protein FlgD [Noviherbaspirillum sp. ST9]|uniref:flagellar hook assembly protein FlgD n=1 Tax=Noviherbaspirillum sp. ST9 TaxID=3401606 RepID=UPI003B589309